MRSGRALSLLAGVLSVASAQAWAQVGIYGFGGVAAVSQHMGTHATFGAGAGVFAGPHLQVFAEYSRVPLVSELNPVLYSINQSARYDNVGGGFRFRFLGGNAVQPFVTLCAGAGWKTYSSSVAAYNHSYRDGFFGLGGGVRILAGRNWGFRAEYRWQQYLHDLWSNYGNYSVHAVTAGPFLQFGGR